MNSYLRQFFVREGIQCKLREYRVSVFFFSIDKINKQNRVHACVSVCVDKNRASFIYALSK